MVPWWKRLGYSLLSAVIASVAVGAGWYCMGGLGPPNSGFEFGSLGAYAAMTLFASLPAWLVAVPFVMTIRNYSRPRLWWILPLGFCIGPL